METKKTESEEREPLHLYRYGGELIAARDLADAVEIWEAAAGAKVDPAVGLVVELDDEATVRHLCRKAKAEITTAAGKLATENGRGIVASTEW